jgi:TolA-binding protein
MFRARTFRGLLVGACCVALVGCDPTGDRGVGEERETHFLAGRRRAEQADYVGAVEAFEQALQNNPRSGAAHFEIGLIFYDKLNDPAAAIYHFQQVLKLQPGSSKADFARHYLSVCKMELVKDVPFNSVNQQMQKELERLTRDNNDLRQQNEQLRLQLTQRTTTLSNAPGLGKFPGPAASLPGPVPQPGLAPEGSPRAAATAEGTRTPTTVATHTVRSGETPYSIARHYGLQTSALLAANPGLDPKRLKVGQVLNLPTR